MYEAIARAEVGDNVFGDDPTVTLLEDRVAELCGKEHGLFVPSGTMGNLVSVMAHTWERGSEYLVGDQAHIYLYEQGGGAQFGGAHPRALPTAADGTLDLDAAQRSVRADDHHFPASSLLCLENTHNMCGGAVLPTAYVWDAKRTVCEPHGIALHMDGARLWHAAAALGEPLAAVAAPADSLSVCLSKALGAPAGSVVLSDDATFIARCRRLRKGLGGTMRQAGVLAGAGLHALAAHLPHLAADHAHAAALAEGLDALPGVAVERPVRTNLVFFSVDPAQAGGLTAAQLVAYGETQGVRFLRVKGERMRMVTHHQVSGEGVARALEVLQAAFDDPGRVLLGASE